MDDPPFGMQLRTIRIERHMSQVELAADLDATPGRVSEWENGKRDITLATLRKIADALHVEPARLLGAE